MKRRSRYGISRRTYKGEKYDSGGELKRWLFLQEQERKGVISDLRKQVAYELVPRQTETVAVEMKTRTKYVEKFREHPVCYIADFVYVLDGRTVIEDFKSSITRKKESYIIKRKLMRQQGHPIREVLHASEDVKIDLK